VKLAAVLLSFVSCSFFLASFSQAVPAESVHVAQGGAPNVGKRVFDKWCAPCHAAGDEYPGTIALAALYRGSKPAALEERTDLTAPIVKQFVRQGVSVMPFFRKTEISDAELDALAAYLARLAPPASKRQ
jgi:mono/diheme cytochrome c family protein